MYACSEFFKVERCLKIKHEFNDIFETLCGNLRSFKEIVEVTRKGDRISKGDSISCYTGSNGERVNPRLNPKINVRMNPMINPVIAWNWSKMSASLQRHASDISTLILSILTRPKEGEIGYSNQSLLETILRSSVDLKLFEGKDASSISEVVGYVNGCLSVSSKRLVGLALLGPVLQQSSSEQLQQNYPSWLRLLTQILQPYGHLFHLRLAASLVKQLLKASSQHPDVSRKVANSFLQPLLEKALQMKDERVLCGLEVLEGCMKYFPGPCGPMRNQMTNHVTQMLGQDEYDNAAEAAGRCFALLPAIGGGGAGGVVHQEAWVYHMTKLIKTAEDVFSELYKDWSSAFCSKVDPEKLIPLPFPPSTEPERTFSLTKQIQKIFCTMAEVLQNAFPVAVAIPFQDILSLICNGLAVQGRTLIMSGSVQALYLLMTLPSIYEAALKLLSVLIMRCGSHLLPHGGIINQVLLQTLNWTASMETDQNQDVSGFRNLRCQVYQVYLDWLNTVGAAAFMGEKTDRLMEHLTTDACLQESEKVDSEPIKSVSSESTASKRKKQKKQHQWSATTKREGSRHGEKGGEMENLCLLTLKVLRRVFFTCGTRLKWILHRNFHSTAVRVLLQCQNYLTVAPSPYNSSANCRKELYHSLLASLLVPSPHWSAPLQSSIYLFSQGRLDNYAVVKEFCSEAATICENIIHPRSPTISTPVIPDQASFEVGGNVDFSLFTSSNSLSIGGNVFPSGGLSSDNTGNNSLQAVGTEVTNGSKQKELEIIDVDDTTIDEQVDDTSSSSDVGRRVEETKNKDEGKSEKDIEIDSQESEVIAIEDSADNNDETESSKIGEDVENDQGEEGRYYDKVKQVSEDEIAIVEKSTLFASELEKGGESRKRKAELSDEDEGKKSKGLTIADMLASFSSEAPDTDH